MLGQVKNLQISISLDNLSPKQLVCDCLDLTASTIKELLSLYYQNNQKTNPFSAENNTQHKNQNQNDFNHLVSTITNQQILQWILDLFKITDLTYKHLIRTWFFELRSFRNVWAHSVVDYKIAHRSFETLSFILGKFNANGENETVRKVHSMEKLLLFKLAQQYLQEETNNPTITSNNTPLIGQINKQMEQEMRVLHYK